VTGKLHAASATRAAVLTEFGSPLVVEELRLSEPGPGEALVRIEATVMCITDVLSISGFSLSPRPFIPGHAAVGVVEMVGQGTDRVAIGQRVVVAGSAECRSCYACVRGTPGACEEIARGSIPPVQMAFQPDGIPVTSDVGHGTMADRMVLRQVMLVPIESDLPPEYLCLLGCGVTSGLGAVLSVADVLPGDSVAISGCGHLGLWMIQAARLTGAEQIIAVEPLAARRKLAADLGATHVVDPTSEHPVMQVKALTGGRGVDTSFEAAGSTAAMRDAFLMARPGGTVVVTGVDGDPSSSVALPTVDYTLGSRRILSSQFGGGHMYRDIPRFARMIERGLVDAHSIVSKVFPLDEVNQAVLAARRHDVISGVIKP
jgi:S-(hydroxymethyl)glutathione dehydrogenase / alcohol dehydrogenase